MAISKARAADTVPFSKPTPELARETPPSARPSKSLTVKLDGDTYEELRDYCHRQEKVTGRRLTHQDVMLRAAKEFLATAGQGGR